MKKIYRIKPILEERVWGGTKLKELFGYKTDLKNIAEVYHVIAIPNHLDCEVEEAGVPLSEFYHNNKELFGCKCKDMPVRLVSGNAKAKLSYHLHPTDEYALKHEGIRGKHEGGICFTGSEGGYSILGHNAKTLDEFKHLAETNQWDKLLRKVYVKKDQFCDTPIGTLHGEEGTGEEVFIAWSTNGDVTYRLYDHGRNDPNRPLHIQEVYDNVNIPDNTIQPVNTVPIIKDGCKIFNYYEKKGDYTAIRIQTSNEGFYDNNNFMFALCISGCGKIENQSIKAGETLFIPCNYGKLHIVGNLDLCILSYID